MRGRFGLRGALRLLAWAPLLLALGPVLAPARRGDGQDLGTLISPGKLSKAHAKLEGLDNCQKCHEPGRKVTAEKCLACHRPVAERIAEKKGVHRDVKDDCVACHVEHAGVDAELRPFDPKKFDHARETGFPLDGLHAPLAAKCESCHKTRSFLAAKPACAACHNDVHKGRLGNDCAHCHTTLVAFKDTTRSFDHSRTAYPLTGAHATVKCAACHKTPDYKVAKFDACNDCHKDPHVKPLGVCQSCHTTDSFKTTRKIEHDRTAFPLVGKHAAVPCATCHVKPATEVHLRFGKCADCHQDPHKGVFKGVDCAACHNESGFKKATPFDHAAKTGYALDGKHAQVACAACHKGAAVAPGTPVSKMSVDFLGAKKECASCHSDPHRGELGVKCETCHNTTSFKVASFQHPRFPDFFTGRHATAACETCHKTAPAAPGKTAVRLFKGVSTECATCHKDAHAGQLGTACQTCHSNQDWKIPAYKHQDKSLAAFFAGKHATAPCEKCHKPPEAPAAPGAPPTRLFKGVSTACATCHKDPHLGQLGTQCQTCHGAETWKLPGYKHQDKNLVDFFSSKHGTVPCADCHKEKTQAFPAGPGTAVVFKGTATQCAACHKDFHNGTLGTKCESCHNVKVWKNASRAFHKDTIFPLEGRHLTTPCGACHLKGVTKGTPNRCFDCHWIRHKDDKYETRLGNECGDCHRPTSWTAVIWNHGQATGFVLGGAHATLQCQTCHKNNVFTGLSPVCASCHQADYDATRNPNHAAAGFPTTCENCHRVTDSSWSQAHFDHATLFPLVGAHATQPCQACHTNNRFAGTPTDCYSCHKSNYDGTRNPNHVAAGFPTTCDTCHHPTDTTWTQSTFNHATLYPLVGVHATQPCAACHANNRYPGTPTLCSGCHIDKYNATTTPKHSAAGFPTTCDTCHKATDADWLQGSFNHATFFQLVGVHSAQPCSACHANNRFPGTPTLCSGCHIDKYNATTTPPHSSAGFPTTCDTCHKATDATWQQGVFSHASFYALVGVHATQPCGACHVNNVYQGTPTLCSGCHIDKYNATTNPNHVSAGFPTTCDTCHKATDTSWTQGSFNHSQFYALVGVHATQPCAACHPNNRFAGTSTLCSGCHIAQYNSTTDPNHAAAGFPTTCDTCHKATDTSWNQGTFNHSQYYQLVGVHATQTCVACHINNQYPGTPNTCAGCHIAQYNSATNPNHVAAGFPTTCDTCHKATDTSWTQGTFNHTWFPITSGAHTGLLCNQCHTVPTNFAQFSCLTGGCHPQAQTNSNHQGVSGYVYSSPACYSCHPNGQAGNVPSRMRPVRPKR